MPHHPCGTNQVSRAPGSSAAVTPDANRQARDDEPYPPLDLHPIEKAIPEDEDVHLEGVLGVDEVERGVRPDRFFSRTRPARRTLRSPVRAAPRWSGGRAGRPCPRPQSSAARLAVNWPLSRPGRTAPTAHRRARPSDGPGRAGPSQSSRQQVLICVVGEARSEAPAGQLVADLDLGELRVRS